MNHTTVPHAVLTEIRGQIERNGYASAYITAPNMDLYGLFAKVFAISPDGTMDCKQYSGGEFSVNLRDVTNLAV